METLTTLWLPILVSAVFVFIVSSVIHMALPVHKKDFQKLAREDELLASMRLLGVEPGQYMFPCPTSMKDMSSPDMLKKYAQGPVGQLTVRPNGTPAIGKSLVQWFAYSIVIALFAGYVGTLALAPGADSMQVFRVTGTVAVLGYAFSNVSDSIWKGASWITTAKYVLDGVAYGLVTGAAFAWLWPAA